MDLEGLQDLILTWEGKETEVEKPQERFPAPTELFFLLLGLPHARPSWGDEDLHLGKVMIVVSPGLRNIQELLSSENLLLGNKASNLSCC